VQIVGRVALGVSAALWAVALSGCGGASGGVDHPPPAQLGIRGTLLPTFSCDASAAGGAVQVGSADVLEVRLCPLAAPPPFDRPAATLTAGSAGFARLLSALSLPDVAPSPGTMCPEYADLVQPVIARTASAALLVHLPVDGCDHTLPAVSSALAAIRG
jgi:hypothetical protein